MQPLMTTNEPLAFGPKRDGVQLLNPGVGNHPVITYVHLSQVDRVA